MEFEQDYVERTVECEQFYMGMERQGTFRNIMNMETTSEEIIQLILHPAFNPLKPNDTYRGRTAPLTSERCILYVYSTNIGTEYFKYVLSVFPLQNAVCFISLKYLVPVLFTFYLQGVLKLKKIIPAPNV
jgi:hypothetical protein